MLVEYIPTVKMNNRYRAIPIPYVPIVDIKEGRNVIRVERNYYQISSL